MKESAAGPAGADEEEVALGEAGLNRRHVDGLKQLRLEQFADPGDLVARQNRVRIGKKSVGGKVRWIGVDRFPSFYQAKLLEAQIAVDSAKGWRCARPGPNRATDATGRPPGCRSVRWLFACPATLQPAGSWSVSRSRRRTRVSGPWGPVPWRWHTRARSKSDAFLFVVGFAQIAADNGVIRVQARGDLDLPSSLMQIALPDLCQTQTQSRQRSRPDQARSLFRRPSSTLSS